jgi:hypothetical protein
VGDVSETVVYYGSRSPAVVGAAEAVERSMTGAVIMAYDPSQVADGAQVTVVTGTDFAVNAPTPATSPTSSAGTVGSAVAPTTTVAAPTTTTTTTPASGTAAIEAPSAASTALAAWDPRACPAGATPTAPVPNRV